MVSRYFWRKTNNFFRVDLCMSNIGTLRSTFGIWCTQVHCLMFSPILNNFTLHFPPLPNNLPSRFGPSAVLSARWLDASSSRPRVSQSSYNRIRLPSVSGQSCRGSLASLDLEWDSRGQLSPPQQCFLTALRLLQRPCG